MSADEFWHGRPRLAESFREAERIRRENRYWAEWRAGIYVQQALLAASPAFREISKGIEHDYPSEPLPMAASAKKVPSEEDRARMRMEENKAAFMAMAQAFNARFAERGEEGQA